MNIQFFGDLSLDGIYCEPQQHPIIRENLAWLSKELGPADFRVINWESPLWGNGEVNQLKTPRLCTTREAAEAILPLKINVALLANNHIYDNGISGVENTLNFFHESGIEYVGIGTDQADVRKFIVLERDSIKVAVLNYVSKETNPKLPSDAKILLNYFDIDSVEADIKSLKEKVNYIVLQVHWGETELVRIPTPDQRRIARRLIEAGANVFVGHHVHCLQGWEKWENGIICYSLGNFLFGTHLTLPGQVHSPRTADTRRIGVLNINFSSEGVDTEWSYFYRQKDKITVQMDTHEKVRRLHQSLCKPISYSERKLWSVYRIEKKLMPFRTFIDKNGGLINAISSIRLKQIKLLRKI